MKRLIRNILLAFRDQIILLKIRAAPAVSRHVGRRRVKVRTLEDKIIELENGKTN